MKNDFSCSAASVFFCLFFVFLFKLSIVTGGALFQNQTKVQAHTPTTAPPPAPWFAMLLPFTLTTNGFLLFM